MAADLADNNTPSTIKEFRKAVLKLRNEPSIIKDVYKYKDTVYGRILPGYGIPAKQVEGVNYFVIGSEKQLGAYESYLKSVEGNDGKLYRLYPRDFWMVDEN